MQDPNYDGVVLQELVRSSSNNNNNETEVELTLMEELLLLGHRNLPGNVHLLNDTINHGLRGCILLELALRDRIGFDGQVGKKQKWQDRKVVLKNSDKTGDDILDEVLKQVENVHPPLKVGTWLDYLCGFKTNPLKRPYKIKHIRERVAKSLVAKGVLGTKKWSFILFKLTTHPIINHEQKHRVVMKIHDSVLSGWKEDPQQIDPRVLSLIFMCNYGYAMDAVLWRNLSKEDSELAESRIAELWGMNTLVGSRKSNSNQLMWIILREIQEMALYKEEFDKRLWF